MTAGFPDWQRGPATQFNLIEDRPANPALGASFLTTVPAGELWRLLAVGCQLVTGGGAGNRSIRLQIRDATAPLRIVAQVVSPNTQGPNLTELYFWLHLLGVSLFEGAGGSHANPMPLLYLLAGWELTLGGQQGDDQFSGIVLFYERVR